MEAHEHTSPPDRHAERRARMVQHDLAERGIRDRAVLAAMGSVPRERFVPAELADRAYGDGPLPIGAGQTISQPFIVALMSEAADVGDGDRVLEVGTGSGYAAAVLATLGAEVWTIERHAELARTARAALDGAGIEGVHVVVGDGSTGLPEHAPYDAIVVTAAGPDVPGTLVDQLAADGRLVMPVGSGGAQTLVRVRRTPAGPVRDDLGGVRFVPLIGEGGWAASGRRLRPARGRRGAR